MITSTQIASLAGNTMVGQDGHKIGKIVDVYESTEGADGTFVTVSTGLFGGGASFVPLAKASLAGQDVVVPYDKDLVKHAPSVKADEELTSEEEDRLYQHYSLTGGTAAPAAATTAAVAAPVAATAAMATATSPGRHAGEVAIPRGADRGDTDGDGVFDDVKDTAVGRDTSGLTTDDAMTRSEERLHVGTQTVEAGRAKLRKRIVAETVTQTVPVSRERAVVTSEPINEKNYDKAMHGPEMTEAVHEVVLREDVPVVAKETVAVERVRLGTQTVTEQATVSEQVRKENIEVEDPTTSASGPPRR